MAKRSYMHLLIGLFCCLGLLLPARSVYARPSCSDEWSSDYFSWRITFTPASGARLALELVCVGGKYVGKTYQQALSCSQGWICTVPDIRNLYRTLWHYELPSDSALEVWTDGSTSNVNDRLMVNDCGYLDYYGRGMGNVGHACSFQVFPGTISLAFGDPPGFKSN